MSERTLDIYLDDSKVGTLTQSESGRLSFQYDNNALKALSLSMPVREDVYGDNIARPFFSGLLPDGEERKKLAQANGVSEGNAFGLLEIVGGDCAGAVSLYLPGDTPPKPEPPEPFGQAGYMRPEEVSELIQLLDTRPLLTGQEEGGIRLSLAGAQKKAAVVLSEDKNILRPYIGQISTHIMKPALPDLEDTAINEFFCMKLAKAIGLNVPEVYLRNVEGLSYLLVERYDRFYNGQSLYRIHQEDVCQALSIPPEKKYEKEGGPNFAVCFDLIRDKTSKPAPSLKQLIQWTAFNYLIGNHDAHGKNLSILLGNKSMVKKGNTIIGSTTIDLAPFYDLISTVAYPQLSDQMAMKIGGEYKPDYIFERHWERYSAECKLSAKYVINTVRQTTENVEAVLPDVVQDTYGHFDGHSTILDTITKEVIPSRIQHLDYSGQ